MVVTREKVRSWLDRASEADKYMLVHSDGFSHEYYPTFHESYIDAVNAKNEAAAEPMQSIREAYDLTDDLERQIKSNHTMRI